MNGDLKTLAKAHSFLIHMVGNLSKKYSYLDATLFKHRILNAGLVDYKNITVLLSGDSGVSLTNNYYWVLVFFSPLFLSFGIFSFEFL